MIRRRGATRMPPDGERVEKKAARAKRGALGNQAEEDALRTAPRALPELHDAGHLDPHGVALHRREGILPDEARGEIVGRGRERRLGAEVADHGQGLQDRRDRSGARRSAGRASARAWRARSSSSRGRHRSGRSAPAPAMTGSPPTVSSVSSGTTGFWVTKVLKAVVRVIDLVADRAGVRHVDRDVAGEGRPRCPTPARPSRIPVGATAAIRRPMARTLSPPGGSRSRSTSAPRSVVRIVPVLSVSGTTILSMRLASTSCDSTSAKVDGAVHGARQPVEVHLEAVDQRVARHERQAQQQPNRPCNARSVSRTAIESPRAAKR